MCKSDCYQFGTGVTANKYSPRILSYEMKNEWEKSDWVYPLRCEIV
jgi:hypothetical protein